MSERILVLFSRQHHYRSLPRQEIGINVGQLERQSFQHKYYQPMK